MKKNYTTSHLLQSIKKKAGRSLRSLAVCMAIAPAVYYSQPTYTFTPCGATGQFGPTQPQVNAAYLSTSLNGSVSVTGGIQTFTIPQTGNYRIEAYGAQGGNSPNNSGGLGAKMAGDFYLSGGTVLKILVGQEGTSGVPVYNSEAQQTGGTGGGGSFVSTMANAAMVVAGGGGGASQTGGGGGQNSTGAGGTINGNGVDGGGAAGSGGTGGNGGLTFNWSGWHGGTGGGGFTGNGNGLSQGTAGYGTANSPGMSFVNGGDGGTAGSSGRPGGFGGGGSSGFTGAGGGGYSGGGAGNTSGAPTVGGGGGGSYNNGANQANTSAINSGNGKVLITTLCNISLNASSTSICSGNSLTLTTNAVSNYSWSTGNTTSSVIVVSPTTTTSYSVSGTSIAGCNAYSDITVTVSAASPVISLSGTTPTVCLGAAATITASGALTYTLSSGLTNGVPFMPSATASYTVSGTNGCGTGSIVTTISVSALPVTAAATNSLICAGTAATLSAGGATTYTWMPGSSTQTNNIINPAANTVYTVTGKTGNCSGVTTITINTKPNPTITIVPTATAICDGDAASLTANGGLSYTWNPGPSFNTMITVSPTVSTLYSVTGINNVNCTTSISQVIVVRPKPVVNASASDALVCVNGSSTLTASGNAATYNWNGGPTGSLTVVNPGVTSTYTVVGTSSANCVNSVTVAVSVMDLSLTVSSSIAVCRGTNVNLSASGADAYHWSTGSAFSSISVTPTTTTTYTINGSSTQGLVTCSVSGAVTVSVNPNPAVTASGNLSTICRGESAVITASGATSYTFAGATPTVAASITVTPAADQTYTVTGEDANGCKGTGSVLLRVTGCVGINGYTANMVKLSVYPNPSNGNFTISAGEAISLQLINEFGQLVRTIDLTGGDSQVQVTDLASGIYFITGNNGSISVQQKIVITR